MSKYLNTREKINFALFVWVYVAFVLLYFQPFGINNYDPQERITLTLFVVAVIIGAIAGLITALFSFFIHHRILFSGNNTQVFISELLAIVLIATGIFFFYNFLGDWNDVAWRSYGKLLANVAVIGVVPVTLKYAYLRYKELKEEVMFWQAGVLHKPPVTGVQLVITAENHKDKLMLAQEAFLYAVAADNYIDVFHLENGKTVKTLMRCSLKSLLTENAGSTLFRSHRSYVVNLLHVKKLQGNPRNLKLNLAHVSGPIPVSRQYAEELMGKFTSPG